MRRRRPSPRYSVSFLETDRYMQGLPSCLALAWPLCLRLCSSVSPGIVSLLSLSLAASLCLHLCLYFSLSLQPTPNLLFDCFIEFLSRCLLFCLFESLSLFSLDDCFTPSVSCLRCAISRRSQDFPSR